MSEHQILRMGHLGDGIAHGPVFAPMTLPGEHVSGTLTGQTLSDIRVLHPSDQRVSPPCRHFNSCGGCQLQHAADGFVAEWKVDVVRSALKSLGLETEFRPIITSPAQSRRRATFAARRTKKGAMAGFRARGSDVVIEVPECQLLTTEVRHGLVVAKALALAGASRKSALAVSVTASDHGLDVVVEGGKPIDGPLRQTLAHLAETHSLARLTWGDESVTMRAPPAQMFGLVQVIPPPGAFLQATKDGEAALRAAVQDAVGEADHIIDLFAGCGTFSLPLAATASVHAVEGDVAMTEALEQGWRMTSGLKPLTVEARDLFRRPMLIDEMTRAQAIVLDPPRAGAEAQVAEICKSGVPRIAYVSCNPPTFARDVRVLVDAGYVLDWVQVVDQFRWSSHIELAARLSRTG
ncbi:class I SAM-dependent RNA methyltransferase [Sulfitobacter sp. TSTF-M16]|uniref:Class I SAM-dependent RNA methyltransferase n=1 Tax=Sulfitobacter aestuariivivens TaxID=2766981 RepID=A0A927HEX4_9RHOB|nr:class I SAM-dependent RNA methyltransferase [Sulfitobacter aestuariivivens]MBD3665257.1 class I SAM-dependent RNA methyltransferase [Sulfitobacter aestuariivivens]